MWSRVRYLQQFGFSLEEIRNALASNDIRQFRSFLQRRREDLRAKAEHLTGLLEDLDWYIGYYSYLESHNFNGFPYYQQEPERYLLAEPLHPDEDIYGTAGKRLTKSPPGPLKHTTGCLPIRPAAHPVRIRSSGRRGGIFAAIRRDLGTRRPPCTKK